MQYLDDTNDKEVREDQVDMDRRKALAKLGMMAVAAYAAPLLLKVSDAHAKGSGGSGGSGGGSGSSSGGDNSGGSGAGGATGASGSNGATGATSASGATGATGASGTNYFSGDETDSSGQTDDNRIDGGV